MPDVDLSTITSAPDAHAAARIASEVAAASTFYRAGSTDDSRPNYWGYAVVDLMRRAGWRFTPPGSPTTEHLHYALDLSVTLHLKPHGPIPVTDDVMADAARFARFLAGEPDESWPQSGEAGHRFVRDVRYQDVCDVCGLGASHRVHLDSHRVRDKV